MIERYDRVDDALHATRAALEEGVLPGGGIALYRLADELRKYTLTNYDKSFIAGFRLLTEACLSPFQQILDNAGLSHHKVLNELKSTENNFGYDVRHKKFGDMFELGVLDPAKVSRCAIENAVSAATMLLMADCSMIEVNTNNNE